jgi:hypothetical protein
MNYSVQIQQPGAGSSYKQHSGGQVTKSQCPRGERAREVGDLLTAYAPLDQFRMSQRR